MWRPILLVAAAVGCFGSPTNNKTEIVGGEEVTIDKIPYQLAMEWQGQFYCGASIISEYWALTAAHCVSDQVPKDVQIRSGSSVKNEGGQLHQVVEIIAHPSYGDDDEIGEDLAVLRVNTPFNTSHIISLAKVRPVTGTNTSVSGWGDTESGSNEGSTHLRWVFVPVFDQAKCVALNAAVGIPVTDRMICAGFPEGGKDSCQGDSGGPLAIGNTQVGVVSKGYGCATESPGVYVDVAALRSWIVEKTGQGRD